MDYYFKNYRFGEIYTKIEEADFDTNLISSWDGEIPWLTIDEFDEKSLIRIRDNKLRIAKEGMVHSCAILLQNGLSIFYLYPLKGSGIISLPQENGKDVVVNLNNEIIDRDYLAWVILGIGKNQCQGLSKELFSINFNANTSIPIPIDDSGTPRLEEQRRIADSLSKQSKGIINAYCLNATKDRVTGLIVERDKLLTKISGK